MRDKDDNIIYVGKAVSLKRRVTSYFRKTNKTERIKKMVSLIDHFEYIVVDNEAEALILECNLIKKNRPKFNVLLKDDKTYPYIKIDIKSDYPNVLITRRIVNDGSKDNSQQIINEYKEKYPNKITAIEQENKGVARTRNESIKRATGKYIMFMDNDDYLDKDYIETFVKEIEKDDCDAVIGGYRRITETGKILKTLKLNDGEWSKYMIMAPWAKIYRTQYLIQNDITFLENNLGEDMYFNLKALLLGNVKSIDYVGYNWFFNTKSVSNTIQKNITQLQVFELIDSCYNMLKENGILEKNYEMIEAHFIKYIIWLILFSTKKLDYKTISKEYDKLFNWLKQKFPNYKKNKVVRLWKPKGELFSIRLIVITMSIANKVGLGKVLVYVYSIL